MYPEQNLQSRSNPQLLTACFRESHTVCHALEQPPPSFASFSTAHRLPVCSHTGQRLRAESGMPDALRFSTPELRAPRQQNLIAAGGGWKEPALHFMSLWVPCAQAVTAFLATQNTHKLKRAVEWQRIPGRGHRKLALEAGEFPGQYPQTQVFYSESPLGGRSIPKA